MTENIIAIALRGPSASGKSTVANKIRQRLDGEVAIIEFDHFRNNILKLSGDYYTAATDMFIECGRIAAQNGYNVIFDGIFRDDENNSRLKRLQKSLNTDLKIFYFDISLEETKRRHSKRSKRNDFGLDKLEEWYYTPQALGVKNEYRIPPENTLEQTVDMILNIANS